jgi:hypothetical protein
MNKSDLHEKLSVCEDKHKNTQEMVNGRSHPYPHRNVVLKHLLMSLAAGITYARTLWKMGSYDDATDALATLVEPAAEAVEKERARWCGDFQRLDESGNCVYSFEANDRTYGFACHSWALKAQGIRQRNIPIRTGDDQERETVGQIEETWVVQALYDRVRMAGQDGAVIEV